MSSRSAAGGPVTGRSAKISHNYLARHEGGNDVNRAGKVVQSISAATQMLPQAAMANLICITAVALLLSNATLALGKVEMAATFLPFLVADQV